MNDRVTIGVADVIPESQAVLLAQGVPAGVQPSARVASLLHEAMRLLRQLVTPAGIQAEVSRGAFAEIYRGEGRNALASPLAEIQLRASRLALFAVTLGEPISARIGDLFRDGDFALGGMLDAAASEAAEAAAAALERIYTESLVAGGLAGPADVVLRYSPGYCGWDVTGQRALFDRLKPQRIGIRLNESCLMEPLKSISGVMVAGPVATHLFADAYPFCADCRERGCRERLRRLTSARRRGA